MIEVPVIAAGVWLLARLGIGDADATYMRMLRLTTVFAGIAALFTAAGIGRLAAHASVDKIGGRRHAMAVAARAHAAAGAGLVLIAAIPNGHRPERAFGWIAIFAMGGLAGAAIGAVCGGASPVRIGDVMAAAIKRPGEALRQLLDPEDLIKLGAAVRDRTTQMFHGVFEPAQRPPTEKPETHAEQPPTPVEQPAARVEKPAEEPGPRE
ncbi:MAG TPA: hypothetical protein VFS15_20335 [Kofleriaceae bacterium]|nr:hypothetical protein [Kofleriaceae bacterium]